MPRFSSLLGRARGLDVLGLEPETPAQVTLAAVIYGLLALGGTRGVWRGVAWLRGDRPDREPARGGRTRGGDPVQQLLSDHESARRAVRPGKGANPR